MQCQIKKARGGATAVDPKVLESVSLKTIAPHSEILTSTR